MTPRQFYNHLILSGTKILLALAYAMVWFYNHLILSGTKIIPSVSAIHIMTTRIFLNNPFFILSAPLKILTFKVLIPKHALIVSRKILLINIRFSEIKYSIYEKIAFIHKKNCRRRVFLLCSRHQVVI